MKNVNRKARRELKKVKSQNLEIWNNWLIELDSLFVDSSAVLRTSYLEFLQRHDHIGNKAEFQDLFGKTIAEQIALFIEHYGLRKSPSILESQYLEILTKAFREKLQLDPKAKNCLETARQEGFNLICVSPYAKTFTQAVLNAHAIELLFDDLVTSDRLEGEESNNFYYFAESLYGSDSENSVVVVCSKTALEDALEADLPVLHIAESHAHCQIRQVFYEGSLRIQGWQALQNLMGYETIP